MLSVTHPQFWREAANPWFYSESIAKYGHVTRTFGKFTVFDMPLQDHFDSENWPEQSIFSYFLNEVDIEELAHVVWR